MFKCQLLEFWAENDESILYKAAAKSSDKEARRIAKRLLARELPKRAAVFGFKYLTRPVEALVEERDGGSLIDNAMSCMLDAIDETLTSATERASIATEVKDKAKELSALLPRTSQRSLQLQTVLFSPRPDSSFGGMDGAIVIDRDERASLFREYMPLSEWSSAFSNNKSTGFVFCDAGWEDLVLIATELVFSKRFSTVPPSGAALSEEIAFGARFSFDDKALSASKRSPSEIHHIKEQLDAKRVYDAARHLRPLKGDIRAKQIADRFKTFQGARGWQVTEETVRAFIRQFPSYLQSELANLLESFDFLRRQIVTGSIERAFNGVQNDLPGTRARVYALSPSSGALWRVLLEADCKTTLGADVTFPHDELDALPLDDSLVVLVDDLIVSGSQSCNQLQAWMGIPAEERSDPKEVNISSRPLSEDRRESLKTRPVRLIVARASSEGMDATRECARGLGMTKFDVVAGDLLNGTSVSSHRPSSELMDYLRACGTALLMSARQAGVGPAPKVESAREDALGYGGRTAYLVGPFNVPTACPAAFWCPGIVAEQYWMPLFIRRGYEKLAMVA